MNVRQIRFLSLAAAALAIAPIASPVAPPVLKDQPMPFHPGETLNYRVSWAAFTSAAQIQLSVPERRDLFGWQTWHFRATAHTENPVAALAPIDDQFDSYTDTASLESRQFESHLDELGKTIIPMAYDIRQFAKLGLLHELITDVNADAPSAAQIARVRERLAAAIADIRKNPGDLTSRLNNAEARVTRAASIAVRRRLAEQWDAV